MNAAPKNILVIKLGALGDFIQALGPMAAIRRHHPDAKITLLTTKAFEEFAHACGYFNDVWIDEKPRALDFRRWIRLRKRLSGGAFTRVYDLQNSDRSAVYFGLFKKRPEWVGAAAGASHRNDSKERTAGHAFDGHVQTLGLAGIKGVEVDRLEWLTANISSFPLRRPYVLIVPGAAPGRPKKRWPAAHYGRVANILTTLGFQTVIIGGPAESEAALEILRAAPTSVDLTGQTSFAQVAAIARSAAGAIGNDTGPMHLIAATGCPVIALFSAESHPVRHAPKGDHVVVLQSEELQNMKPEKVMRLFRPREEPPRPSSSVH